jgi:hypothetical protein
MEEAWKNTRTFFLVKSFIYISEDIASHDLPYPFLRWMPIHVGFRWIQWH